MSREQRKIDAIEHRFEKMEELDLKKKKALPNVANVPPQSLAPPPSRKRMRRSTSMDIHSSLCVDMSDESTLETFRAMDLKLEPTNGVVQPPVHPEGQPHTTTFALRYILNTVLEAMYKHHYVWPFIEPVDAVKLQLSDYHSIVKYPMDLNTIKKRIENGFYYDVNGCIRDFQLLFYNCYRYNRAGEDVYVMAKAIEKIFSSKMKKCPKEFRHNLENTAPNHYPASRQEGMSPVNPDRISKKKRENAPSERPSNFEVLSVASKSMPLVSHNLENMAPNHYGASGSGRIASYTAPGETDITSDHYEMTSDDEPPLKKRRKTPKTPKSKKLPKCPNTAMCSKPKKSKKHKNALNEVPQNPTVSPAVIESIPKHILKKRKNKEKLSDVLIREIRNELKEAQNELECAHQILKYNLAKYIPKVLLYRIDATWT